MNRSRMLSLMCFFTICTATSQIIWASPVNITSNIVDSRAFDTSLDKSSFSGVSIPSSETLTATQSNSSSTTNINYSGDATSINFTHDFSHSIDNTVGDTVTNLPDYAETYILALDFIAVSDSTYYIDGFYSMLGPSGTRTVLDVWLIDQTSGSTLFRDFAESFNTTNESFALGIAGDGDYIDTNIGSLTGNLISGHNYRLLLDAFIQAADASFNPTLVAASATGEFNLNIVANVPIPSAIWLFSSGLLGLVAVARRKAA